MISTYTIALGYSVDIGMIINFLVGILFIVMGNYMHKIKQNYTVGIKIPWTLSSEKNWNKTHRMASWLFIIGGILFCINGFFKMTEMLFVVVVLIIVVPMVYSFVLYRKGIWFVTDNLRHRNTTLIKTLTGFGWHFLCYHLQVNPLWAIVPFLYYRIEKKKL